MATDGDPFSATLIRQELPGEHGSSGAITASYSSDLVMISKEIVNRTQEPSVAEGVRFERRPFLSIFATKHQKESMKTITKRRKGDFRNR